MTVVGEGDFRYELDESWPNIPEGWELGLCSDVAIDSRDRVFVFNRNKHPVAVFDEAGTFVTSWGEGEFKDPHGIYIGPGDEVWVTDTQDHVVTKHTPHGEKLLELGTRGHAQPSITNRGQHGQPFNMPTGIALNADGEIFVSDGYGNKRVHRFSAEGELKLSWGVPGLGPGEFALVHNLGIDTQGRVLVCDRENSRIQIFDQEGGHIETWERDSSPGDVYVSPDGFIYVTEGGRRGSGVSILTESGAAVSQWHGAENGLEAAHGIWVDSKGNIYVAEIGQPGHGQRVRKYAKI